MSKRFFAAMLALTLAGFLQFGPMTVPANAAPLGAVPASTLAGDADALRQVQFHHHNHRRHHHHHGWGHRHHGWGHHHHYRRHHHHGWGHHHHGWGHHHHHRRHHHHF
ncbi:protein of unknown function; putative exported protein [Methylorubrum extorquens]|uniref:Uncharacterized protein n=1 Tax=Methylorubrum extorquens TaxID=408 RepID=A0A2N9ATD9_METEX|nr:protein of unknown function; putative exported protein [Methylorubrum extorquens]